MTSSIHIIRPDTTAALKTLLSSRPEWSVRRWARELQLHFATLGWVLHPQPGKLSLARENEVRRALGLPLITQHIVEDCPDCGGLHPRCYGRPPRPTRARRITRWADLKPEELARALAERVPYAPP